MILLDTHVLIWSAQGDPRLGRRALAQLGASESALSLSAISYWEVGMLSAKGRLHLTKPVRDWVDRVVDAGGIEVVAVTSAIAADAGTLPSDIHGDPLDRIIIATARALGCPLATADRKILAYAQAGHVQAIDARL